MIINLPSFPYILLKKELGEEIINIIKSLDKKTGEAFLQKLTSPCYVAVRHQLREDDIKQINNYLNAWHIITNMLLKWLRDLAATWQDLIKHPISADDLLTISILSLPADIGLLKKISSILEQISSFEVSGETAYAITNLYSAISIKLLQEKTSTIDIPKKVALVINELQRKNEIEEIKKNCEDYKKLLYGNIKAILRKDNDDVAEIYHLRNISQTPSIDELVFDIIEEMKFKMLTFPFNHEINLFIKKYLLLNDMITSLTRKYSDSMQKQIEFAEKFIQHEPILRKNNKNSYLNYEMIYQLFGWQTQEEYFLKSLRTFTQMVKKKEARQQTVSIT